MHFQLKFQTRPWMKLMEIKKFGMVMILLGDKKQDYKNFKVLYIYGMDHTKTRLFIDDRATRFVDGNHAKTLIANKRRVNFLVVVFNC